MAKKSSSRKANKSDFEIGEKYRYNRVFKDKIAPSMENSKAGMLSEDILDGNDMEQMLNAYLDEQNVWTLNVNSTFYAINIPDEICSWYTTTSNLYWTTISFNIYGTTRLAWLLMKLNNVVDSKIFDVVPTGTSVRYLDKGRYVDTIIGAIQEGSF